MYFTLPTINHTTYTMKKIKFLMLIVIATRSIASILVTAPCIIATIKLLSMINTISFDGVATPIALSLCLIGLASLLNYIIWQNKY